MDHADAHRLLEVAHLSVWAPTGGEWKELIHDISFTVNRHEVLVLLGESGSGKTVLSRSLTTLFAQSSRFSIKGSVHFEGQNLLSLVDTELSRIRRCRIRYVFQEPMQSLNPMTKIGKQLRLARDTATDDASLNDALRSVGLDGEGVLDLYPHQLSVGMAQRVCIAMAVLPAPSLLIADEPTSALDASMKYAVLDLLVSFRENSDTSLILVTHDLEIAHRYGDRIIVLFGGRIVEAADRKAFLEGPLHPYSRLLMDSHLKMEGSVGAPDVPVDAPPEMPGVGCRFHLRCPSARERCSTEEPGPERVQDGREVRCFYWR